MLDPTQQGAGLAFDGSYYTNTATNYIGTAISLVSADEPSTPHSKLFRTMWMPMSLPATTLKPLWTSVWTPLRSTRPQVLL